MFVIPENIEPPLVPLSWLLGCWQGWGSATVALSTPEETKPGSEDSCAEFWILQRIEFTAKGQELMQVTETYRALGDVEMTADAAAGMRQLKAGELLWRERAEWTVEQYAMAEPGVDAQSRCRVYTTREGGEFAGETIEFMVSSMGPRISAQSVDVSAAPDTAHGSGVPADAIQRMFGLVAGELMWASDRVSAMGQSRSEFSARLARA